MRGMTMLFCLNHQHLTRMLEPNNIDLQADPDVIRNVKNEELRVVFVDSGGELISRE